MKILVKNLKIISSFLFLAFLIYPANNFAQKDLQTVREKDSKLAQNRGVALAIGNSDYKYATTLNSPVNDAEDMAKTLKNLGFKVLSVRKNASLQEMENAVAEFGRELEESKGIGVFYYSGHGVQSKGSNYLIPVEASVPAESFLKYKALDVDAVLQTMANATSALKIVILDACRNNPFAKSWGLKGSVGDGLAVQLAPKGMLIAYATSPNDTASDGGKSRNSLYTEVLLREIIKPKIGIVEMFNEVGNILNETTNGDQTPWISNSPVGKFCFAGCNGNTATDSDRDEQLPTGERAFWREMEKRNTIEAYQAYLRAYPKGEFVPLANLRVSELKSRLEQANRYFIEGIKEFIQRNQDRAILLFSKALELDPNNEIVYASRANSYTEKKEFDKALADYNKAVELKPNASWLYNNRGNIYLVQKNYDKALSDYNKAIELDPKDAYAYNGRGSVYFAKGEYSQAINNYTRAIELNPKIVSSYQNRATLYELTGRQDLAEADRQKIKELEKANEKEK